MMTCEKVGIDMQFFSDDFVMAYRGGAGLLVTSMWLVFLSPMMVMTMAVVMVDEQHQLILQRIDWRVHFVVLFITAQ